MAFFSQPAVKPLAMFSNYFKIAWRNLKKNKVFSFINIAGLAIGMAACLLILQYVLFELSFDQFNKNAHDIYRVVNDRYQNGKLVQHGTITYSAIGKALKNDYPEVAEHARVEPFSPQLVIYQEKKIGEQRMVAVDHSFLRMFSYPLLAGDAGTALQRPNCVILSRTLARKLFSVSDNNLQSVVGKTIIVQKDSLPYQVTGICENAPVNSHLQFDFLLSYNSLYSGGNGRWKEADHDFTDSDFWHYVQLRPGTDYKALEAKLPAFSQKYFRGNKVSGSEERFYLQPLLRAHLYSDFEYEIGITGNATVVWGLLIIAGLIIVIAWVNYINLSTAKSMERAREVGVRKVAGATRKQLISQFLAESLLINMLALLIAVMIVLSVQSGFNGLVQRELSLAYLFNKDLSGYNIVLPLTLIILGGILCAGCYPAFILSGFQPILVLKGRYTSSGKGVVLRKVLVVAQFAITVMLIVGSLVVYRQIRFMQEQELGMNIDQMLIIKPPVLAGFDSTFITRINSLKEELKQIPQVKGAATSSRMPGVEEFGRAFNVYRSSDSSSSRKFTMRNMGFDYDYINVYGIKLTAGRNFLPGDYNAAWGKLHNIILNESAVKLLGFSSNEDALGKTIMVFNKKWDVIGTIQDFHQKSLRYRVEPNVFLPTYGNGNPISVKVAPQRLEATIAAIKAKYMAFFPGNLFDYYFLDERFNRQYQNEQLFGKVFSIFAAFAICIACLGVLGLSLFATAQRTKEIGIRKILGASVANIVLLLTRDFLWLVMIAFLIASPLAWFIMHGWLQDFAYRINIQWWIFVLAGLIATAITLITISFQTIRAALANPVKSLNRD